MANRIASTVILVINLVLAYVAGVISIIGFFTRGTFADMGGTLAQWVAVLVGFALLVGLGNLVKVHIGRVFRREEGWYYSLIVVGSALAVLGLGLIGGGPGTESVAWVFQWIYQPLGAAVFSLLAFFLTTALFQVVAHTQPRGHADAGGGFGGGDRAGTVQRGGTARYCGERKRLAAGLSRAGGHQGHYPGRFFRGDWNQHSHIARLRPPLS